MIASWVATPGTAVAVNVIGLPVRPVAVAVTVFVPATVPSVHEVRVPTPLAFVTTGVAVTGTMLPPPAVTVKVTDTPATGLPFASRTSTDGGAPTGSPTVSLCEVREFAAICDAAPATTLNGLLVALPRPVDAAVSE